MFREKCTAVGRKEDYTKGECPPIDVIIKFKFSVIRRIYTLLFDQAEYQINDRLSFMRFLGPGVHSKVLGSRTIWDFENTLAQEGVMDEFFEMVDKKLEEEGRITRKDAFWIQRSCKLQCRKQVDNILQYNTDTKQALTSTCHIFLLIMYRTYRHPTSSIFYHKPCTMSSHFGVSSLKNNGNFNTDKLICWNLCNPDKMIKRVKRI